MQRNLISRILPLLLAILAWTSDLAMATTADPTPGTPPAIDLQADAQVAAGMSRTLLIVFVSDRCAYCEIALNEFLIPMSGNPDYGNRIIMRRIVTNQDLPLRDFRGDLTTHRKFAKRLNVRMTPVIQMFDTRGLLLGKPLIGVTTLDYYGDFIDQTIDKAIALTLPSTAKATP
jgi:thioredoxin-related protein